MKEIQLTEQELEELKDTIAFRTKVVQQLKGLNGIPKTVWEYGIHIKAQWFFISIIISMPRPKVRWEAGNNQVMEEKMA